jgi:hypothetical protein
MNLKLVAPPMNPTADSLARFRDPWQVSAEDFPTDGSSEEKLWFVLNYGLLAPSSHNAQPWRFRIHGSTLDLYADRTRSLPVSDPNNRELTLSCGAALLNLRVALEYFGYANRIELFPTRTNPICWRRFTWE